MTETWARQLVEWREFYLLVGTAAATLMALMFVVVSLRPPTIGTRENERAFMTPVIVYFSAGIFVPGLMLTPGLPPRVLSVALGLTGVGGLVYLAWARVLYQWRVSKLPMDDWIFFVALPALGFALFLPGAVGVWMRAPFALYAVEASVLLFLLIGIRNAWDLVLWISSRGPREP
jgi:hypothetical protein